MSKQLISDSDTNWYLYYIYIISAMSLCFFIFLESLFSTHIITILVSLTHWPYLSPWLSVSYLRLWYDSTMMILIIRNPNLRLSSEIRFAEVDGENSMLVCILVLFAKLFRMELRCVIAIIRHGDRTPKQKMKMEVRHPL